MKLMTLDILFINFLRVTSSITLIHNKRLSIYMLLICSGLYRMTLAGS
jgi:hypothetical protein